MHPGIARTNLLREDGSRGLRILEFVLHLVLSTPERAAAGIVHLATSPDTAGRTGGYYGPFLRKLSRAARDTALATRLWELSEELTDFQFVR